MEDNMINQSASLIKSSKNIVVLTGAGMSTESGIPDFRSDKGIYNAVPEVILSYRYFAAYPKEFYDFAKKYFTFSKIEPNIGHQILAEWEKRGIVRHIITQNIDGLHQKAGSKNVLEVHGTFKSGTCQNKRCSKKYNMDELLIQEGKIYDCSCGKGLIKPDVVLYDEQVDKINDAIKLVRKADLFLILGTSLIVYPVANLPLFLEDSSKMIIINYTPTDFDSRENCSIINGGIGETLSKINILL